MTDVVDSATHSRMMAGIGSRNTKPELVLRRALHARGLRFRLHVRKLPGTPALVFRRFAADCFVHGCFCHPHEGCRYTTNLATRKEFWQSKFAANVERDRRDRHALLEAGWRDAVIWECALRKGVESTTVSEVEHWLREASASSRRALRAEDGSGSPEQGQPRLGWSSPRLANWPGVK